MGSLPPWVSPDARLLPFQGFRPLLGSRVFVASGAVVIGDVVIGDESSIWYNVVVRGDVHQIRVGRRTNLQDAVVVHVTGGLHSTHIGDCVTVGHGAIVHGCTLDDGCLVGMGAKVLDGARVGAGAFIGAGSVVSPGTAIPPGVLALGAPARVVRPLTPEDAVRVAEASGLYVEYAESHAREQGLVLGVDERG